MSRHLLLDRPDRQIVLGFDHPLQSFFGQVFRSRRLGGTWTVCGGWPTRSGLGTRRPIFTTAQRSADLSELTDWARAQIPDELAREAAADFHLGLLVGLLLRECMTGSDAPEEQLPDCLK